MIHATMIAVQIVMIKDKIIAALFFFGLLFQISLAISMLEHLEGLSAIYFLGVFVLFCVNWFTLHLYAIKKGP